MIGVPWRPLGESGEVTDGVLGGVAGPDDGDASLGVATPVAAQDVGDPDLDQIAGVAFSDRRPTIGADRVRGQQVPVASITAAASVRSSPSGPSVS